MNAEYFRSLYDYSCWARDRLFAAMGGLSEEEYGRANGFTYPSVRAALVHCLGAEARWFASLRGEARPEGLDAPSLPTVESLVARWRSEEAKIRAYLESQNDADLAGDFRVRRHGADPVPMPVSRVITHVLNHNTQHRSEVAEMLTAIGRSPGDLDLIDYYLAHATGVKRER